MTSRHVDVERKYEVDAAAALPDLTALPKVVAVQPVLSSTLEAVYSDTDRLSLADAGITLRRRTGGSDAGWHLKLPRGGDDRAELGEPLSADDAAVPAELLAHVRAWTRDQQVRPVATLVTRRVVHRLLGDAGKVLAEVSDDIVTATSTAASGEAEASSWREWEIELVEGSRKLLTAADELFGLAGATHSAWPSKLHRAMGRPPMPTAVATGELPGSASAGQAVTAYLADQRATILARDADVRTSEPDAVHKVRVATRRLRSVLSSYRPLFDRTRTDPLRAELKWFAEVLGGARDAEVQREHLLVAVAAEPPELVLGPLAARIEVELRGQYRIAHDRLVEAMDSGRYFRLLDELDALVTAPPLAGPAADPARPVLERRVRAAAKGLVDLAGMPGPADGPDRDAWLHEIRKSAKRLRYAAELAAPVLTHSAAALAVVAEDIQETLGDHQDSVVIRRTLRGLAVRLHADGENAFTLGRLHAQQQARATAADERFRRSWRKTHARSVRGWRGR